MRGHLAAGQAAWWAFSWDNRTDRLSPPLSSSPLLSPLFCPILSPPVCSLLITPSLLFFCLLPSLISLLPSLISLPPAGKPECVMLLSAEQLTKRSPAEPSRWPADIMRQRRPPTTPPTPPPPLTYITTTINTTPPHTTQSSCHHTRRP